MTTTLTSPAATECRQQIANTFLTTLYAGSGGYLNICRPSRPAGPNENVPVVSQWFNLSDPASIAHAAAYADATNHDGWNVWFMTGLTAADLGQFSKGKETEITSLPGLHADVDVADPVHKKAEHLPPTFADALRIIAAAPLPPTMIIKSGHGLQPYWLFGFPADVSAPEDRERIKSLLTRWQAVLRAEAHRLGQWELDSTHNLDRLMRIPGTFNMKAKPIGVKIIEFSGRRYTVEELEAALPAETPAAEEIRFNEQAEAEVEMCHGVEAASAAATPSTVIIADSEPASTATSVSTSNVCEAVVHEDDRIIAAARNAKNGAKFSGLFDGPVIGQYASDSEAAEALACILAFWTRNRNQIKRIMDRSTLCKGYAKWQRADIPDHCIDAALKYVTTFYREGKDDFDDHDDHKAKRSQADVLANLCDAELFHDDDHGYATVSVNGHRENHAINSAGFGKWLLGLYWTRTHKAPSAKVRDDALASISARATFEGPQHETAIRLAEHNGNVYLDLCNEAWQAVEITDKGWQVVDNPPVRFIRRAGMLALPVPVKGGRLNALRPLINAIDETTWTLLVAWLLGAMRPRGPYPILIVNGEQGSAKSCVCRILRGLVDPNQADLRSVPRNEQDLLIAATNSRCVGFDNLSGVQPWLSDALCRLATGAAYATRTLYSNADETIFSCSRPCIVNGIEDLASRPDLSERAVAVYLPVITPENRRTEAEIGREFEAGRPGILGALCDAVSASLAHAKDVRMPQRPRMADFAEWVCAAEIGNALPWPQGQFMAAYSANILSSQATAVEHASIGPALERLLDNRHGQWTGTVASLLDLLESMGSGNGWEGVGHARHPKDWPQTSRGLSGQLRRLAPALRAAGIGIEFHGHTKAGSTVAITRTSTSTTVIAEEGVTSFT